MTLPLLVRCCCVALLSSWMLAQEHASPGMQLQRAFVDADGGRRIVVAAAADAVLAADPQAQEAFVAALRAIAAVAPARQPAPDGSGPAAKATEFTDAQRQLMAAAIGNDPAARKAALASLAADATAGAQVLQQLDERGRAILARAVSTFVRKQRETNAIYTGQYARLYAEAADYYQAAVAALEAKPGPIPGLPTLLYNTACNLALAGQIDEAFAFLGRAVDASIAAKQPLAKSLLDIDHDIDGLRPDPRFQAIYERLYGKPTGGK